MSIQLYSSPMKYKDPNTGNYTNIIGISGNPGRGISSVELNNDYTLTITFDDNTSVTTTSIRGNGIENIEKTSTSGLIDTYTITDSDGDTYTFTVSNGMVPNLTIGTVVEGASAAATITGTRENPVLNLVLPSADLTNYATKEEVPVESGTSVGSVQTKEYIYNNITYTQNASARGSIAIGGNTTASGINSFAEGSGTIASAAGAHAEGENTTASSGYAHAEGSSTTASASYAHAEGKQTTANATGAHTEGRETFATASYSHAEGRSTSILASGKYAHSEGQGTISAGQSSHVGGEFNVEDNYDNWPLWSSNTAYIVGDKVKIAQSTSTRDYYVGYICKEANNDSIFDNSKWVAHGEKMNHADIVGNGTADDARSNAYALDWDGNGHYMGDVYVHANSDSSGGTRLPHDVQVAGASVVSDGVANVPMASTTNLGVVMMAGTTYGIGRMNSGAIYVASAASAAVKSGTNDYNPIVPYHQHESVFYGLTKAAGVDMASSANAVGTYTEEAKTAIKSMLGVQDGLKVVRLI